MYLVPGVVQFHLSCSDREWAAVGNHDYVGVNGF